MFFHWMIQIFSDEIINSMEMSPDTLVFHNGVCKDELYFTWRVLVGCFGISVISNKTNEYYKVPCFRQ